MRILLLILLIIVSIYSVSAVDVIDVENFESYTLSTEINIYNSLQDETDTDGVAENFFAWLGALTTGNMSGKLLINTPPTNSFNEIVFDTVSVTGTPGNDNFIYDVYICETNETDLNASNDFSQCTSTPELISNDFPMSTVFGNTITGNSIYLNQLYNLDVSKMYIIHVNIVSSTNTGANNFYSFSADSNGVVNDHTCRITGAGTCIGFGVMNNITLKKSDFGAGNLFAESDNKFSCVSSYPTCVQSTGAGTGTASFEVKQEFDNKYINLYSNGGDNSGYRTVRLYWDHTNSSAVTDTGEYTIQVRMRINSYFDTFPSGTNLRNAYAGVSENFVYDSSAIPVIYTGAVVENNDELHQRIRGKYKGLVTTPLNSSCDINDGEWHYINAIYDFDTIPPYDINLINLTVDGVDCESYGAQTGISLPSNLAPLNLMTLYSSGSYDIDLDELKVYNGKVFFPPELLYDDIITDCPISNCLFYDDFEDNTVTGWTGDINNTDVIDGVLYFEKQTDDRIIENNINGHDFNSVVAIHEILFNDTTTPDEINKDSIDNFYIYQIRSYCAETDNIIFSYNLVITKDDVYTGSENSSVMTIFVNPLIGGNRQIGSLVIENGKELIIKNGYDYINQKAGLNFLFTDDIITGFNPDLSFNQEFLTPCQEISGISVERRDNADLNGFAGFDRIYWYGLGDSVVSDDFIYETINQTNISNAIVPENLDDLLHNSAFTLGFRSSGMLMLFWLLLMVGVIVWLVSAIGNDSATKYIIFIAALMLLIIGWYLKFIPTIVFTFIIFAIVVLGAFIFKSLLSGGGVSE